MQSSSTRPIHDTNRFDDGLGSDDDQPEPRDNLDVEKDGLGSDDNQLEPRDNLDVEKDGLGSDDDQLEPRDNLDVEKEMMYDFGPRDLWSPPPDNPSEPPSPCVEAQTRKIVRKGHLQSTIQQARQLGWTKIGPKVSARWGAKKCAYCHRIIHDIWCVHYKGCPYCEVRGCMGDCTTSALYPEIPAEGQDADEDGDDDAHSLGLPSDD